MASDLALLKSFVDGQGAGAATYITYDADLDFNFSAIETQFNALNAEFRAFGGQNAALIYDLTQTLTLTVGFIGAASFATSFLSANTVLRVARGEALTSGGRLQTTGNTDLTGSGSSGIRYAALRATGVITLETSASQGALDLYSVNWNGSSFDTGTLTRLPGTGANNIIVDADDFQAARVQPNYGQGSSAALGPFTYDRIADRVNDLARVLGGRLTSAVSGQTLKGIAFGGGAGTPGILLSDGTTYDTTTGLFRQAANVLGVTVQGTEAARFAQAAASQPQLQMRAGTALATPPHAYVGDADSGFGWVSGNVHRAIAGGAASCEFRAGELYSPLGNFDVLTGTGANRWGNLAESIKTGTYTIVAADRGGMFVANSASAITFNLTAAATLGAGFAAHVRNIGAGTLTLDPNSAELIEGAATLTLEQGQAAVLWCTGTEWRASIWSARRWSALPERVETGASYSVVGADAGSAIVANRSSAIAFNLQAAATLGASWVAVVRNIGTGLLTVDPSGAETINGAATLQLPQNHGALIWSTGTALRALVMRDAAREFLTADRDYWVRSDGSDSNDGSANSSGSAFLTLQHAVDVIADLDIGSQLVRIRIGLAGTYAGFTVAAPWVSSPGSNVLLLGDTGSPGSYVISSAISAENDGSRIEVQGVDLTSSGQGLRAAFGGTVTFSAVIFGACTSHHVYATQGGRIFCSGDYDVDGAATIHWAADFQGYISCGSKTIDFGSLALNFSSFFAYADGNATMLINGNTFDNAGSVTGTRYFANLNGSIQTFGGGATYLPGDAAGSQSAGGEYA